jgi:hypothetical protein
LGGTLFRFSGTEIHTFVEWTEVNLHTHCTKWKDGGSIAQLPKHPRVVVLTGEDFRLDAIQFQQHVLLQALDSPVPFELLAAIIGGGLW